MPDRSGEPRPGRDEPPDDDEPEPIDLDPPEPTDYRQAAKRGMAQIRQLMGWPDRREPNQPKNPPESRTAPRNTPL